MPQQTPWSAHELRHFLKHKSFLVDPSELKELLLWYLMDALMVKRPV